MSKTLSISTPSLRPKEEIMMVGLSNALPNSSMTTEAVCTVYDLSLPIPGRGGWSQ
ncbi:hypothetical protein [Sulfolobus acidocaldarius]|uniref:hypothetical protein n=1 Tax=Sulfolobus acidocaldarius TaxID=2285 RepID=UPI001E458282|nr:hypothetical protein [Sulfolobus acidocaldarius]